MKLCQKCVEPSRYSKLDLHDRLAFHCNHQSGRAARAAHAISGSRLLNPVAPFAVQLESISGIWHADSHGIEHCWRHDAFYQAHASYVSWSHPGLDGSGNILSQRALLAGGGHRHL